MRTIYILRCIDNSLYTGITTDLHRRIEEHNHSPLGATYTKSRRPVHIVYTETAKNRSLASKREYALKKLSKSEKELLVSSATKNLQSS